MTVQALVSCDGCHMKRATGRTARAARKMFVLKHGGMTFAPGSRDFCAGCVEQGKHLKSSRSAEAILWRGAK